MEWVAVASLVVSAATLYLVVQQERRQRRNAPHANLSLHRLGDGHDAQTGELVAHIWELTNSGNADARVSMLYGVGCRFAHDEEYPPVRVVKAGEPRRLKVEPCDVKQAWVIITWTSPHLRNVTIVEWLAPDPSPQLAEAIRAAPVLIPVWQRLLPSWLRWRLHTVRAVGPGGVTATRVRTNSLRQARKMLTALSLAEPDAERLWPEGLR